ncbi:MAG: hypothetical protein ACRYGA_13765 [Janthinobacterium lividum]
MLRVEPDAWVVTDLVSGDGAPMEDDTPYAQPTLLRRILSEDVDLSLREPVGNLLRVMTEGAQAPDEKAKLQKWVEDLASVAEADQGDPLSQHIVNTYLTVMDLLEAFPSCQIDLASLLEILPKQKPRLYFISSSSLTHPEQVQVTIGVVQVKTTEGRMRQGCAQVSWLHWTHSVATPRGWSCGPRLSARPWT